MICFMYQCLIWKHVIIPIKKFKLLVQFEQIPPQKSSIQGSNRTHRLGVRVPWPNLYSTEVVNTYASGTYTYFKF